jgi:hypothetical protein
MGIGVARGKAVWPTPVKAKKLMEISFEFAQDSIIIAQRGGLAICQLPSSYQSIAFIDQALSLLTLV